MYIRKLTLEKFKRVDKVEIDLHPLNVLVGGNNAGKSSVLQGIHFSVIAAISSREAGKDTYTQDSLLYCPAKDFSELRHGTPYLNQSNFGFLKLEATFPDGDITQYVIRVYRARNEGNVGCQRTGSPKIGALVASSDSLFSIYVPGLAGVSQSEQYRTESVVRRGVASGDANLYLRNVLWLIKENGQIDALTARMKTLFPKFSIRLKFDPRSDVVIDVRISITGPSGRFCSVELVGTGVLQALQIFSYVTLFEPRLLLLDEPDSHLHPDNQVLLASALQYISAQTSTQIIVSTHSRHLVDALHEDANFVWLKDGKVFDQGVELPRLPLLLDIGALDNFDKLMGGAVEWVVLSEDANLSMIKTLVASSGYSAANVLFFSYKTSSNLEPAKLLSMFIKEMAPQTKIIIHRDRDFMTDDEVDIVANKISQCGAISFITEGSDIESYFVRPEHISSCYGFSLVDVVNWLDGIAQLSHNDLFHAFTRKRDAVKGFLYRDSPEDFPATMGLIGNAVPLLPAARLGKAMLKLVRSSLNDAKNDVSLILNSSEFLFSERLKQIKVENA